MSLSFWIWLVSDRFKFLNLIDCSVWVWLKFLNLIDCGVWFVSLIWLQCLIGECFWIWLLLVLPEHLAGAVNSVKTAQFPLLRHGLRPTPWAWAGTLSYQNLQHWCLVCWNWLWVTTLSFVIFDETVFIQCLSFSTHFVCEKRLGNIDSFKILVTQRMGLPPSADFTGQTGPAVQKMIGNGMHVACVGQAVGIGVLVRSGLIWAHVWSLDQCKMGPTELRSLDLCRRKHKEAEFGYGADSEIIRLRSISCSVCMSYYQGHRGPGL